MRNLLTFLALFSASSLMAVNVIVYPHDVTSGSPANRNVTVTLTGPAGQATSGAWIFTGDSRTLNTGTGGSVTFSNLLAIGQYRLDISGNPPRSFPFSISQTNGTYNVVNLLGTNNSVPVFYDSGQVDFLIATALNSNSNYINQVITNTVANELSVSNNLSGTFTGLLNATAPDATNAVASGMATNAVNATNLWGKINQTNIPTGISVAAATSSTNFFGVITFTNMPDLNYTIRTDTGGHQFINTSNRMVLRAIGTNVSNSPGAALVIERPNAQTRAELQFPMPGADVNDATYSTNYIGIADDYGFDGDFFAFLYDARRAEDMLQYGLKGAADGRFHFGIGTLDHTGGEYTNYFISVSDPSLPVGGGGLGIYNSYVFGVITYSNGYYAKMLSDGDGYTIGTQGDQASFYALSKENGSIVIRRGWANSLSSAAYGDFVSTNSTSTALTPGVLMDYWQPSADPNNATHWSRYYTTFSNVVNFNGPITSDVGISIASSGNPWDALSITSGGDGQNFITLKKENGSIALRRGFANGIASAAYGDYVSTNSSSSASAPGLLLDYWQPNGSSPHDSSHWSTYNTTISNELTVANGNIEVIAGSIFADLNASTNGNYNKLLTNLPAHSLLGNSGAAAANATALTIGSGLSDAGGVLSVVGVGAATNAVSNISSNNISQGTTITNLDFWKTTSINYSFTNRAGHMDVAEFVDFTAATNEALRQATSLTNGAVNNLSNLVATLSLNSTNEALRQATSLTNGAVNNLSNLVATISGNATNEALRQATSLTNGAVNNLSNYVSTISANATNRVLLGGVNSTNNDILMATGLTNGAINNLSNYVAGVTAAAPTLAGQNNFSASNYFAVGIGAAGVSRMGILVVTNGITNSALTANSAVYADANGRLTSIPAGGANQFLKMGVTPPAAATILGSDISGAVATASIATVANGLSSGSPGTNNVIWGDANQTNGIFMTRFGLVESNNVGSVTLTGGTISNSANIVVGPYGSILSQNGPLQLGGPATVDGTVVPGVGGYPFVFVQGNFTANNGVVQNTFEVNPTITQSGTAGYSGISVDANEVSLGSGVKDLMQLRKGGSVEVNFDHNGNQTNFGNVKASAFYGPLHGVSDSTLLSTNAVYTSTATNLVSGAFATNLSMYAADSGSILMSAPPSHTLFFMNTNGQFQFNDAVGNVLISYSGAPAASDSISVGKSAGPALSSDTTGTFVWDNKNHKRITATDSAVTVATNATVAGTLGYWLPVAAKTANYAVVIGDSGTYFNNAGAVGAVTNSLPASTPGQHYGLAVVTGQNIAFKASGTETIRSVGVVSGAGGLVFSSTVGATLHLYCPAAGGWFIDSTNGAFTIQ